MEPILEETVYFDHIVSVLSTGALVDADSTPTAAVFEEGNDTPILTPTVTKRTALTGHYRIPVACTAANGFEAGKSYNLTISFAVSLVVWKRLVASFQIRSASLDTIAANITTLLSRLTADRATALDNLDVAVSDLVPIAETPPDPVTVIPAPSWH